MGKSTLVAEFARRGDRVLWGACRGFRDRGFRDLRCAHT
jgi:hypothetical protein